MSCNSTNSIEKCIGRISRAVGSCFALFLQTLHIKTETLGSFPRLPMGCSNLAKLSVAIEVVQTLVVFLGNFLKVLEIGLFSLFRRKLKLFVVFVL